MSDNVRFKRERPPQKETAATGAGSERGKRVNERRVQLRSVSYMPCLTRPTSIRGESPRAGSRLVLRILHC